ncbi:Hint domain-containing protein [Pararhodobacter zhoushanensis]|uniref:Hint domain-containing protein n=1 Tax=Pararhodobacter zhoushanensis TaxID=2479545 RepID=A0ABT3GYQ1_9RHOB|nr:Hint domain-containing protein [Pararhodobacter zhoushanensis]MCW1932678.1 Hint domain-containing protein [Pararhodobacter zhoushanensis]
MLSSITPQLSPLPLATRRSRPTGLVPGTLVRTRDGEMPVEFLLAGDLIETADGLVELRGTSVLAARDVDVVVIEPGAPVAAVGQGRALVVPVDQQVLVSDWRAMILHGQAQMLTPASSLVDDLLVRRETRAAVPLIRLHFDTPQVIRADGIEVASASTRAPVAGVERYLH